MNSHVLECYKAQVTELLKKLGLMVTNDVFNSQFALELELALIQGQYARPEYLGISGRTSVYRMIRSFQDANAYLHFCAEKRGQHPTNGNAGDGLFELFQAACRNLERQYDWLTQNCLGSDEDTADIKK